MKSGRLAPTLAKSNIAAEGKLVIMDFANWTWETFPRANTGFSILRVNSSQTKKNYRNYLHTNVPD